LGTLVLAAGGLATALPASPASAAPVTIQLLNINDFHGRIDANTTKWATTIEGLRDDYPSLLLGAGDLIGASVFASAVANDQPTIDVMNAMELDASAVGNHEFDKGWADLRDRVIGGNGPNTPASWDYLAANITDASGALILDPYAIFPVGGIDVAVIGAVTLETPTIVSPAGIAGLTFTDPVEAVNKYAGELTDGNQANGEADVVVAEYHEGGPSTAANGVVPTPSSPVFDHIVNDTSANVDVIFTGHTHKAYAFMAAVPNSSVMRPVLETGEYGANIGKVTLTLDDQTGDISASTVANVPTATTTADTTFPRVALVNTIVNTAIANAAVIGAQPKGSVTADITRGYSGGTYSGTPPTYGGTATTDRTVESTLGGTVAQALLETLAPAELGGAQIGVVNPGGLRDDLLFAPDGTITYAEANAVLPFVNNLWTTTLTGAQFKAVLEQQWRPGAYLQLGLSENVTYTFDSTLPEGSRITSITVDGEPIDPAANYRIGSFNFLLTGGDSFTVFTQGTNTKDSGLVDRDGWIKYLEDNSPLSPNFAKRTTEVSPLPTTAVPGERLQFAVSTLDMKSLGSPQNTALHIAIGGVDIGTVPVVNGAAAVDIVVPSNVPSGAQTLTLLADPTNTLVSIPVTVPAAITPLSPQRILDTRIGGQTVDSKFAGIGIRPAGSTLELDVAGRGGVPTDATGVVLNLTSAQATGVGYVTVWPCGSPRPVASSVNFAPGGAAPNAVVTGVGTAGKVCIYTAEASVELIADVNGLVPADGGYQPLLPARLLETRVGAPTVDATSQGEGPRGAGTTYTLQVTGRGGVPADAKAVSLNVTSTDATGTGYITVWDCADPRPVASSVNFVKGAVAPNAVLTKLSATGTVCLYVAEASTDVLVDVFGYFTPDAAFGGLTPARLLETRPGAVTVDGEAQGSGPLAAGATLEVQIAGRGGVPDGALGAVLNVTANDSAGDGYVTVWPCGETRPNASTVNFVTGVPSPNAAIVKLGTDGKICLYAGESAVQLIVDVTAYL
jgi:5'-nucleotidase